VTLLVGYLVLDALQQQLQGVHLGPQRSQVRVEFGFADEITRVET
jgi:hypothetical protein